MDLLVHTWTQQGNHSKSTQNKKAPEGLLQGLRVEDGARTHDPQNHNLVL